MLKLRLAAIPTTILALLGLTVACNSPAGYTAPTTPTYTISGTVTGDYFNSSFPVTLTINNGSAPYTKQVTFPGNGQIGQSVTYSVSGVPAEHTPYPPRLHGPLSAQLPVIQSMGERQLI